MRRRNTEDHTALAEAYRKALEKQSGEKTVNLIRPKGECKKCGKHIGRGVGFHTRNCKGK